MSDSGHYMRKNIVIRHDHHVGLEEGANLKTVDAHRELMAQELFLIRQIQGMSIKKTK